MNPENDAARKIQELEQRRPIGFVEGLKLRFYKRLEQYLLYKLNPKLAPDYKPYTWRSRFAAATLAHSLLALAILAGPSIVKSVTENRYNLPSGPFKLPPPPLEVGVGEEQSRTDILYPGQRGITTYEWGVILNDSKATSIAVKPGVLERDIHSAELGLQTPDRLPVIFVLIDESARTDEQRKKIEAGIREDISMAKILSAFATRQSINAGQSHLTIISISDALDDAAKNLKPGENYFDVVNGIIRVSWASGVRNANNSTAGTAFPPSSMGRILTTSGITIREFSDAYYKDKFGLQIPTKG